MAWLHPFSAVHLWLDILGVQSLSISTQQSSFEKEALVLWIVIRYVYWWLVCGDNDGNENSWLRQQQQQQQQLSTRQQQQQQLGQHRTIILDNYSLLEAPSCPVEADPFFRGVLPLWSTVLLL